MPDINLSKYKAVFFDVGGTLLKVHPSVGDVYARYARPFGFTGTPQELDRRFGVEWKRMGGMESLGLSQGVEVEKKFWSELVHRVFAVSGGLRDFDTFFATVYEAFRKREHWKIFADVTDSAILPWLKNKGIIMGIVSNWDSRLPDILASMELAHYFDFILASTVVGSAKPDKFIFQEALRLSGADPAEACHIGDDLDADFHGARNVGVDAILIDRAGKQDGNEVAKIGSFHELVTV